ncbi:hypothetical protein GCM10009101_32040 [Brevundimonas lenta]
MIAAAAHSSASNSDVQTVSGEMGWHLTHEAGMAKLAYGVENSDQLALMMTCEQGGSLATVYGDVQPASPRLIHTAMTSAIDPLSGGLADEARISTRDPAMRDLARKGKLAVEGDAGTFELTATPKERRLIGEFFAYCGNDHA